MAFLTWTPDLNTGIDWVDTQHRQIVHYINELHEVQGSGQRDKIGAVMENLVLYTVFHFTEEEQMLARANYPLLEVHKGVHQRFIDKLNEINSQYKAGLDTVEALLKLLETWLFSHIQVNDRGYIATVKKAGADQPVS